MERAVDAMSEACEDFINAAMDILRSHVDSDGLRTPENEAAMQGFKDKWELFKEACDRAEDLVLTARRILSGELAAVAANDGDDDDDDDDKNCQIVEHSSADGSTSDAAASACPPSPQASGSDVVEDAAAE